MSTPSTLTLTIPLTSEIDAQNALLAVVQSINSPVQLRLLNSAIIGVIPTCQQRAVQLEILEQQAELERQREDFERCKLDRIEAEKQREHQRYLRTPKGKLEKIAKEAFGLSVNEILAMKKSWCEKHKSLKAKCGCE